MPPSRIAIHVERPFSLLVDRRQLRKLIRDTLAEEGSGAAVVDLVVTDDETVRRLNATYRGRDETTDVLSFSLREGSPFVSPPDGLLHLGEVIISYPQAARQAGARPVPEEMAHLVVHGLLHLLGYDHEADEAEARMRAQEERHLSRFLSQGA